MLGFVIFIGIFFAVSPAMYADGLVKLFPRNSRDRLRELLAVLGKTLRAWLFAQLVLMTVIGVSTWVGLMLIGLPLALSLAVLAFFTASIPTIGPAIALAVAALVALTVSRIISLPPAITLSSQLLLSVLFGFLGLLLAVPIAAVVMQSVKLLYVRDVLGEEVKMFAESD